MAMPGDVIRVLDQAELPPSARELPEGVNPLAEGILMLHQRQWIKQIHEHDLNIAEKGRRTGITYATALDDAITASSQRLAGGDNCYYIGDTKEKGLEYIGYAAHMAKVMAAAMAEGWQGIEVFLFEDQQPDGSSKQITSYRIRFASGFQIVALSSSPANIRGLQGNVTIDEAAFHKNVSAVIDAALALIIWGGKLRIISTHNTDGNAFNQLIKDSRAGLFQFKVFRCTFDDAVANGLYERVCLVKGWTPSEQGKKEWYQRVRGAYGNKRAAMEEELDAIPREGSGVAIPGVLVERCMREERPILRLALDTSFALQPDDVRKSWCEEWIRINLDPLLKALDPKDDHVLGGDYARHCDFSVQCPMAIKPNLTRSVPFGVEMHNVPTRQQEQIIWHLADRLPNRRAIAQDATGNGAILAEYTADRYGHQHAFQVMLNDFWYREFMGKFEVAFQDGIFDLPKDLDWLNDIRTLERINGIIKLPDLRKTDTKNQELKRHGDAAIAICIAYFASLQDVLDTTIHTTSPRHARQMLRGYA